MKTQYVSARTHNVYDDFTVYELDTSNVHVIRALWPHIKQMEGFLDIEEGDFGYIYGFKPRDNDPLMYIEVFAEPLTCDLLAYCCEYLRQGNDLGMIKTDHFVPVAYFADLLKEEYDPVRQELIYILN